MRSEGVECEGVVRGWRGGGAVTGVHEGVEGEGSRGSPSHLVAGEDDCNHSKVKRGIHCTLS